MADSRKLRNRDRLSELPDSLIITILSFLEMRDAVRTTVLSKRWKDRWTSLTSLNFSPPPRVGDLDTHRSFVNDALLRWKGAKILRFDLLFSWVIPPSRDLDSWLLFAIGKQVEELRLRSVYAEDDDDSYYCPPQRLYTCSSIRKLTLSYVKLSIPETVQLSQLTSLTVEGLESLSGPGMTRLLSGAPMLEELSLLSMEIEEDFNIRSESLKKLQIDTIELHSVLSIWAPNLSTLEIKDDIYGHYRWQLKLDVPSLTTAILNFYDNYDFQEFSQLEIFHQVFQSVSHAQSLTISDGCAELLLDLKVEGMSVEFSNAKHLQVFFNDRAVDKKLLAVLRMFPKLLTFIATLDCDTHSPKDDNSFSASEKKIDIPLLHLKTCEIRLSETNSSILRAIKAVLENGKMLEKMVIQGLKKEAPCWGTLEKVLSIRRSSPNATVIVRKYRQGL